MCNRALTFLLCAALAVLATWNGTAIAAQAGTIQSANMHALPSGVDVAGGGTLHRTRNALRATINTTGLDVGAGYTVWWVIFNNPDACSDPCGLDDLGTPAVEASVYYGTGFVTGGDGTANVSLTTTDRGIPEGADVLVPGGLEPANGFSAEVHLVVRTHSGLMVGSVDEQIGSFAGQCGPAPDFPNCMDQQAVIFEPVE